MLRVPIGNPSDEGEEHFRKLLQLDFFDLIVSQRLCYRGKPLAFGFGILQICDARVGTTATPKETKYVSNISYFGDSVYTYSVKEGMEDEFDGSGMHP